MGIYTVIAMAVLLAAKTLAISDQQALSDRVVERAAAMLVASPLMGNVSPNAASISGSANTWKPDFLGSASPIVQKVTNTDFSSLSPEIAKLALTNVDGFGIGCVFNCAVVLAAAPCIIAAAGSEILTAGASTAVIAGCVAGGGAQICPCSDCIGFKQKLEELHFC